MTDAPARGHVLNVLPDAAPARIMLPPHRIPDTPPPQRIPHSSPVDHPTLSCTCSWQSSTPKQKRRRLLQLNMTLECPGPCTQPLDLASMAHALRNYKRNKACSLSASDSVNTIQFYDMKVISMTVGNISQPNLIAILVRDPTNRMNTMSFSDHRKLGTPYLF